MELKFVGIKNSIPKTLNISDLSTIDSVVVEIVYKGAIPAPPLRSRMTETSTLLLTVNPLARTPMFIG
ncbi:MAG: hypothetical protein R2825_15170 [Saprospiraceae bacterium]